jgi:mRNA-degrading endonuclease RelE of RelBE toxin-antitoxin system
MLKIDYSPKRLSFLRKMKNVGEKDRIKKQIQKIIKNPEIGKPMKHGRKGTREVYVGSFRLAYSYFAEEQTIVFLDLYHKDTQ